MTGTDLNRLYPYTRDDTETVKPSEVRVGDLIASAGPPGSGRLVGNKVTFCGWAGFDPTWGADKYLVTTVGTNTGHEITVGQPDRIPMWRIRADSVRPTH